MQFSTEPRRPFVKLLTPAATAALLLLQVAELPKPLIPQLMDACHAILSTDSEENGMVAQRVLFDMHKTYKQALEEQSGPFFTWLQQLYSNLPQEFAAKLGQGAQEGGDGQVPANRSFKLASEVALMIVFLFQCHPRRLQENAATLLPLMVKVRAGRQGQGQGQGRRVGQMGRQAGAGAHWQHASDCHSA